MLRKRVSSGKNTSVAVHNPYPTLSAYLLNWWSFTEADIAAGEALQKKCDKGQEARTAKSEAYWYWAYMIDTNILPWKTSRRISLSLIYYTRDLPGECSGDQ